MATPQTPDLMRLRTTNPPRLHIRCGHDVDVRVPGDGAI